MEQWKDVVGYEDLYQVSSFGRVKSKYYNRIIKPEINRGGYSVIRLTKDKKRKAHQLHRLVALHFIPNQEDKPQINHKDCDKQNNCIDNLEWVTAYENCLHRSENGLSKGGRPWN